MDVQLVAAPYFHGRYRMHYGLGPERLVDAGIERALTQAGHRARVTWVEAHTEASPETRAAFEVVGAAAKHVASAVADGALPIVLAGNCHTACLSVLAGLDGEPIGLIWFDAHGDFNTPETTVSGYFDGMGLSLAIGDCWQALRETIPSLQSVATDHVVMIGARDFDERERQRMNAVDLTLIAPETLHAEGVAAALDQPLAELRSGVSSVYIHVDLDVLDPREGMANDLAVANGLSLAEVTAAIAAIGERFTIAGAGLTCYEPSLDGDGRVATAAMRIATEIADAAAARLDA